MGRAAGLPFTLGGLLVNRCLADPKVFLVILLFRAAKRHP